MSNNQDRYSLSLLRRFGENALRARRIGGVSAITSMLMRHYEDGDDPQSMTAAGMSARIMADWAECAFPTIQLAARLGESFMATRIPPDVLPELIAPWPTMLIELPPHTLVAHDLIPENGWTETEFFNWVIVQNKPSSDPRHLDNGLQSTHVNWYVFPVTAACGLLPAIGSRSLREMAEQTEILEARPGDWFNQEREYDPDRDTGSKPEAVATTGRMLLRFVLGCLLELDAERGSIAKVRGVARGKFARKIARKQREPSAWIFKLTRSVRVDCRAFVCEASQRGEHLAKTVQSLVRGHWKNQPYGPGGSGRKFIHIEPYWRGPEDAPIAVRSHILKGPKKSNDDDGGQNAAE